MCDHPEPAQTTDVLDHAARVAAERIGSSGQSQGHVVPAVGADLHTLDDEDAAAVGRWTADRGVAVVGQNDEVEVGRGRGRRHLVHRPAAVRPAAVDVEGAAQRRRGRHYLRPIRGIDLDDPRGGRQDPQDGAAHRQGARYRGTRGAPGQPVHGGIRRFAPARRGWLLARQSSPAASVAAQPGPTGSLRRSTAQTPGAPRRRAARRPCRSFPK